MYQRAAFPRRAYAVLIRVSPGYPPPKGRFPRVTHPSAARQHPEGPAAARLACVRHAASVQSEPGSNSSVQSYCRHEAGQILGSTQALKLLPEHLSSALALPELDASTHTSYPIRIVKDLPKVVASAGPPIVTAPLSASKAVSLPCNHFVVPVEERAILGLLPESSRAPLAPARPPLGPTAP